MPLFAPIISVLNDLKTLVSPAANSQEYKFAFIVHPRNSKDVQRKFPYFKHVPEFLTKIFMRYLWPITLSKVTGLVSLKTGKKIDGYVISILPAAHQMFEDRELALKRITQACILARKKGAKIVGLGGLTSSFSKGGLDLVNNVSINITTGHAYTGLNVTQNVIALTDHMGLNKDKICVGIVGAAGSIGSTTARLLLKKGYVNFIFIDLERKKHHCAALIEDLKKENQNVNIELFHQINFIKTCDIVVAATNAPEALIKSEDLKWGAIVVDDAQPSDVDKEVFKRKDVLVIEAGVTFTPGIKSNFNFGLKNREDNFCCMAELLILAANEWDEHYVINRPSLELVEDIEKMGKKLGFKISKFQNFNELISFEKLEYVRKCINQHEY